MLLNMPKVSKKFKKLKKEGGPLKSSGELEELEELWRSVLKI